MERNYELLKDVLSVATHTYQEELMIEFIENWLVENNLPYFVDDMGNIYVTKQTDQNIGFFPCVVAHTDTVHKIDTNNIRETILPNTQNIMKPSLNAFNNEGKPTGIGGDDKCGVYACLELLKELPNLKAAFFVSEETGCYGSRSANKLFFENVGYAIQFDAPGNRMITEISMGTRLFELNGDFHKITSNILNEEFNGTGEYGSHPYTDIYALKHLFDFSCINISIGYYRYHTRNEYVVIEDVYNGINVGKKIIEGLSYKKYKYLPDSNYLFNTKKQF